MTTLDGRIRHQGSLCEIGRISLRRATESAAKEIILIVIHRINFSSRKID